MALRLVMFLFGIGALLAQFLLGIHEDRSKRAENEILQTKLKRIEDGINELVSQGRLTRPDAQKLLIIAETVHFHEDLQIEKRPAD